MIKYCMVISQFLKLFDISASIKCFSLIYSCDYSQEYWVFFVCLFF